MKIVQRILAAILIGVAASMMAGPLALAQTSGGIGGRPANPDPDNPRTESIFIYTLDKGASTTDEVRISNNSDKTHTIELLAVDGIVTNTGAYTCKQNSEEKVGVAAAIKFEQDEVTLAPGENQKIGFMVTMPHAADVGEHNACLVFQSKQDEGETTGNIRIRTRQAIRLVATVPGRLNRSVNIDSFNVQNDSGKQTLTLVAKNAGNVSADIQTKVRLTGLFGRQLYSGGGQYPVLANQKLELPFENTKQPFFGGVYTAEGSLSYNKQPGTFGVDTSSELVVREAEPMRVFIRPTVAGLVTMLVIAGAALTGVVFVIASRRRRSLRNKTWKSYEVKSGEDIQTVAQRFAIDWRDLAKQNNLKPPYHLPEGTRLKVPSLKVSSETERHKKG